MAIEPVIDKAEKHGLWLEERRLSRAAEKAARRDENRRSWREREKTAIIRKAVERKYGSGKKIMDARVLRKRTFLFTTKEIAKELGVTAQEIEQLEETPFSPLLVRYAALLGFNVRLVRMTRPCRSRT